MFCHIISYLRLCLVIYNSRREDQYVSSPKITLTVHCQWLGKKTRNLLCPYLITQDVNGYGKERWGFQPKITVLLNSLQTSYINPLAQGWKDVCPSETFRSAHHRYWEIPGRIGWPTRPCGMQLSIGELKVWFMFKSLAGIQSLPLSWNQLAQLEAKNPRWMMDVHDFRCQIYRRLTHCPLSIQFPLPRDPLQR